MFKKLKPESRKTVLLSQGLMQFAVAVVVSNLAYTATNQD